MSFIIISHKKEKRGEYPSALVRKVRVEIYVREPVPRHDKGGDKLRDLDEQKEGAIVLYV
jgi:hypothetical protein